MNKLALLVLLGVAVGLAAPADAAETYKADPVHSSAVFRAHHAGAGYVWGRFNDPAGTMVMDEADPAKSTFSVEIQANNVDTGNPQRDAHLKSPDFFNAKQYPTIKFKSTSVKTGEGPNMLAVSGDLTIHGVTKSITIPVELTGTGEFPPGVKRAGVEATLNVKLTDYEIKGMPGALSDDVKVIVSLEGMKG